MGCGNTVINVSILVSCVSRSYLASTQVIWRKTPPPFNECPQAAICINSYLRHRVNHSMIGRGARKHYRRIRGNGAKSDGQIDEGWIFVTHSFVTRYCGYKNRGYGINETTFTEYTRPVT
jgi:hypothetical protein